MKSKIRIKKIHGIEYWYEDVPFYDKTAKQIRHHSKYLGKNIDGKPVRVREVLNAGSVLLPSKSFVSYGYGELLPILKIIEDLHVDRFLGDVLNEQHRNMVLTLCINRVVRPTALHIVRTWFEGSFLSVLYPGLSLSSQNISNLLARLGDSDIPSVFMGKLLKYLGTKSTLMYDITSLSSYSKLIDLLEFGHNRDDPGLPQLNMSMIVDKKLGIPVMYDVYPGSIVDVSTLKNTIRKVESYEIQDYLLVLDRGFFSQGNLEELLDDDDLSFIIPATMALNNVKELMSSAQRDIENPKYLQKYNKDPIFVKPVTLSLDDFDVDGYCYYDQKREQSQRNAFYTRLYDVREKIQEKEIPGKRKPEVVFKVRAGDMASYYSWEVVDKHFKVEIKKKAVTQRVNKMGKFILFYRGACDWMKCLMVYREKDIIEKAFERFKRDLKGLPLNTSKESTTRGFLFVCFVGLILEMRLLNQMKETGLLKDYTVEKLLLELEKIKKVRLANDELIVTEITRRQKGILEKLNLCA
ncbi:MAG: IS1634 family transposase [Petrotogales bacterium]